MATGVAAAGVSGGWWATSTSGLQYCLSETLAGGGVVGVAVPSASCAPAGAAVDGDDGDVEGGTALRRPGSLLWVFCNPGRVLLKEPMFVDVDLGCRTGPNGFRNFDVTPGPKLD